MASNEQIASLQELSDAILNVDQKKLLRVSLGDVALQNDFDNSLETIRKRVLFARQYAPEVHHDQVQGIVEYFGHIRTLLEEQAGRSNQDYVANRDQFLKTISSYLEEIRRFWAPFVTAAVESRGFLDDEGIRREYEETIESIKSESEIALRQVKEEANKTIEEARELAKDIENRARSTASGVSVKEAQNQFQEAQSALNHRVKIWALLGGFGIAAFLGVAVYFLTLDFSNQEGWYVVYFTVIRVSILAAIGTVAAFCLKILRAHMHMSEKNRHRQRVANSMGAFVDSAATPEQRDMILSQLVESIVQFGNSGLINRDDDNMYRPKMTIDSISRTLLKNTQKD